MLQFYNRILYIACARALILLSHAILWQAWDLQPEKRPSFHDIKVTLGQLRAEYTKAVN